MAVAEEAVVLHLVVAALLGVLIYHHSRWFSLLAVVAALVASDEWEEPEGRLSLKLLPALALLHYIPTMPQASPQLGNQIRVQACVLLP